MLNLNSIMLCSQDPKGLIEFYKKLLEKEPDWADGDWAGWQAGASHLVIGRHSKVQGMSVNPERIILNFETSDVEGEFKRMQGLGAVVVKEPYHPGEEPNMWIATLADPEGNFFQLASPFEPSK